MDLITFTLSKNHLWSALSIAGLAGITYLTNRYVKNTEQTTNQTYYKPLEILSGNANANANKIYIFWNGDMSSTYLLLDLLLQDKIIQPFYIERYTIIKNLEKDKLEKLSRDITNKAKLLNNKSITNIAYLKKEQDYELKQLEILRLMILTQYPEFKNNLLPTTYITTIAKDLDYTSKFYNALLEIKPIHSKDIELIEQIGRFLKYYFKCVKGDKCNTEVKCIEPRVIFGCNKDYKNRELLINLLKKNIIFESNISLDIPLLEIDKKNLKFMAVGLVPSNIMPLF
jgi:hypothetical protein